MAAFAPYAEREREHHGYRKPFGPRKRAHRKFHVAQENHDDCFLWFSDPEPGFRTASG